MTTTKLELRQALFFILMTAILAAGCSDSTGPTTEQGSDRTSPVTRGADNTSRTPGSPEVGTPAQGAAAPAEGAAGSPVLKSVGPDGSGTALHSPATSALGSYTRVQCQGGYSSQSLQVPTVAGVPFKYTGSGATQRVWFRANFWSQSAYGGAYTYWGSGEWFYTYLAPGQQSTTMWYRAATGQAASWTTTKSVPGKYNTRFFADGEYQWEQNGRVVASQTRRGYHLPGGIATTGGNMFCHWPI